MLSYTLQTSNNSQQQITEKTFSNLEKSCIIIMVIFHFSQLIFQNLFLRGLDIDVHGMLNPFIWNHILEPKWIKKFNWNLNSNSKHVNLHPKKWKQIQWNGTHTYLFYVLCLLKEFFTGSIYKENDHCELEKQTNKMSPINCINVALFERNLDIGRLKAII